MKKWFDGNAVPLTILAVAACAVFGQMLRHEFIFNWDDTLYVVDNPAIKALSWGNVQKVFSTAYVCNYAPVQMLSYMVDYALWGMWAGGSWSWSTASRTHFESGWGLSCGWWAWPIPPAPRSVQLAWIRRRW